MMVNEKLAKLMLAELKKPMRERGSLRAEFDMCKASREYWERKYLKVQRKPK